MRIGRQTFRAVEAEDGRALTATIRQWQLELRGGASLTFWDGEVMTAATMVERAIVARSGRTGRVDYTV